MIILLPVFFLFASALALWHRRRLTLDKFLITQAVSGLTLMCLFWMSEYQVGWDQEVISGRIQAKRQVTVSCQHSYSCNCVSTTDSRGNTTTICATCWEHSEDYDWVLNTNALDEIIRIPRVDSQGTVPPPRWTQAVIQEPVALQHVFRNYLRYSPNSVLLDQTVWSAQKYPVPEYPLEITDFYHLDRFLTRGYTDPQAAVWNQGLSEIAGDLGPTHQVNPLVLVVGSADTQWEHAVRQKWLGGKKNDVILLLGVPQPPRISWVRVISWTRREDFKIQLRDQVLEIGDISQRQAILQALRENIQTSFVRTRWREYEYLQDQYEPSTLTTVMLIVIAALINLGGAWWMSAEPPRCSRKINFSRMKF